MNKEEYNKLMSNTFKTLGKKLDKLTDLDFIFVEKEEDTRIYSLRFLLENIHEDDRAELNELIKEYGV
ncbi:hypothetical protein [Clostridium perfringens]|nr:hypothetical protein [Clostridium perfringens]MDT7939290.1 hypothetical protein [Clostridium perfringens]